MDRFSGCGYGRIYTDKYRVNHSRYESGSLDVRLFHAGRKIVRSAFLYDIPIAFIGNMQITCVDFRRKLSVFLYKERNL